MSHSGNVARRLSFCDTYRNFIPNVRDLVYSRFANTALIVTFRSNKASPNEVGRQLGSPAERSKLQHRSGIWILRQ
jgi:hypothetical protein